MIFRKHTGETVHTRTLRPDILFLSVRIELQHLSKIWRHTPLDTTPDHCHLVAGSRILDQIWKHLQIFWFFSQGDKTLALALMSVKSSDLTMLSLAYLPMTTHSSHSAALWGVLFWWRGLVWSLLGSWAYQEISGYPQGWLVFAYFLWLKPCVDLDSIISQ